MYNSFQKLVFLSIIILIARAGYSQIKIQFDSQSGTVFHGVKCLRETLMKNGHEVSFVNYFDETYLANILIISNQESLNKMSVSFTALDKEKIKPEGYQILKNENDKKIIIASADEVGAMYGLLELSEFMTNNEDLFDIDSGLRNPYFEYRIIKFNLPWSPYRDNPATRLHIQTCRDLQFWERFLDMMAENRFNVLSLWNLHPFTYMIRALNYPDATPFNEKELSEWRNFWKVLFRMARERGIQTFIVNWNIVVSPEFAEAYSAKQFNDLSELVKKYTRESVTQLINEYEDLTGIGVTLADWMNNFNGSMSAKEREDWIEETFVAGMKNAKRKVKFLHRSVLSGSPIEMRRVINHAELAEAALVEIKFNWSHGHSTPTLAITHDYHSGEVDDRFWNPKPENYNIQWMIRNEDFFILRWGQPDFIRKHIEVNSHDYVNGYFIGSEGYIPALDYSHKINSDKTWQYGFEKQWLFYTLWGRLLYDPETPDKVFEDCFERKFGIGTGSKMLEAYSLASNMPLRLASFYRSTWDYTLYSEGFLAPRPSSSETFFDGSSDFISIDELIYHETLDPQLISINDYVDMLIKNQAFPEEKTTPIELALDLEQDGINALEIVDQLYQELKENHSAFNSELEDLKTWSYLSLYFSDKLRAGVLLQSYRKTGIASDKIKSVEYLNKAMNHWKSVIEHTKNRYLPVPHVSIPEDADEYRLFSWEYFLPQIERDIRIAESAKFEKE